MSSYYLAGRVSRREELREWAQDLIDMGHTVTSQWLWRNIPHANHQIKDKALRAEIAAEDMNDIRKADVFLLASETTGMGGSGGRLVEFGYALGRHKLLVVVGPMENLFLCLPGVLKYEDWEEGKRNAQWLREAEVRKEEEKTAKRGY